MCGIAGIFYKQGLHSPEDVDLIQKMNDVQKHRGPDDEGVFAQKNCVLGHTRLAIIDLSKDGRQPFASDDERYQIVFNGEIYNYIELREELKSSGWEFKTHTDTEVLIKSYQAYGRECLNKFNGMFAFAIYDSESGEMFAARDRVGIKPLYYTETGDKIFFASEIKALMLIDGIKKELNKQSLFDYLVFNRTDIFDKTFFEGIYRLPKGHYCVCSDQGMQLVKWWDPTEFLLDDREKNLENIKGSLDKILISSVKFRMRSDVPVGSCISGGLDSSILLGILMQHKMTKGNYSTFSACFPGEKVDEAKYVDDLKGKYEFVNHKVYPSSTTLSERLNEYVCVHDEPTLNPSYYAQYELMRIVKEKGVTVLLDGQGGDENFAGYHYLHGFYLSSLLKSRQYIKFFWHLIIMLFSKQKLDSYKMFFLILLSKKARKKVLFKRSGILSKAFFQDRVDESIIFNEFFDVNNLNESLAKHFQYKLEHLLRAEDRSSMAFSIETRVPYLDNRLIEYLLGVDEFLKISKGATKHLEKIALGKYSSSMILERKDKLGFDVPADKWMQEDAWEKLAEESLSELKDNWNDVFKVDAVLPKNGDMRWKIIQLNTWRKLYLDN